MSVTELLLMLVFPLTPCEKISLLHYACKLFTVLCPATLEQKFSQPAARLCTTVLLLFFFLIILDSSFGLPCYAEIPFSLCWVRDERKPPLTSSAHNLSTSVSYRASAGTTSACRICRALACKAFPPKQSFSSFRLNYGELVDFRLYQTLFVRETKQKRL